MQERSFERAAQTSGTGICAASLDLLLAEMQALGAMMPGLAAPDPASGSQEAQAEDTFDNMPV